MHDGVVLPQPVTRGAMLRIGRPRVHKRISAAKQTAGGVGDQRSQAAGVLTNTGEQLESASVRCAGELTESGEKQAASNEQCPGETPSAGQRVVGGRPDAGEQETGVLSGHLNHGPNKWRGCLIMPRVAGKKGVDGREGVVSQMPIYSCRGRLLSTAP